MTQPSQQPRVSIIIPVYNGEAFIAEAVESALNQDYSNIEVIVVNDGSTDGTEAVLQPYMNRILYIKQDNAGLSAARNRGILESAGEFLAFLDADDLLMPNMVSSLLPPLLADADCGLAYGGHYMIDAYGDKFGESFLDRPSGWVFCDLINDGLFVVGTCLVRRSVLAKSGIFDPILRQLEDRDLWLRIAHHAKFAFVPVHVACYRSSEDSMSRNWRERKRASHLAVRKLALFLLAVGKPTRLVRSFRRSVFSHHSNQCVQDAFVYYWKGCYNLSLRKMVEGVTRGPRFLMNRGVWAVMAKSLAYCVRERFSKGHRDLSNRSRER